MTREAGTMTMAQRLCGAREGSEEKMARLVRRVRSEYLEMPGLRLAPVQAARLLAIDPGLSESVLEALVADGFLSRTRSGAYLRAAAV